MFPFAEEQAALCRDRLVIRSVKPMENKKRKKWNGYLAAGLFMTGLVVFFQRRPIAEVFTRKIDAGAADTDFASEILGYGIADREIFQTQIGEILKIAVVFLAQRTAGVGIVAARTGEVGIAIILRPAVRIKVLVDERSGRKGIGAPEVEGGLVGSRIPVATSDALEEGRYVESHPVETQPERVVVTGQRVADDAFVARIVHLSLIHI